ncbi:hypothetical protein [Undibacter mobilis]|nr:hypothetical protein [Undibacter mobilis]
MAKRRRAGRPVSAARAKTRASAPRSPLKPAAKHIITVKRFGRRAPSPMNFTDNLLADARRRYETTLEPLTWIAQDLDVCRTTLRSFAARNGWVRFNAPPLDISPAARLAQQTDAFVRATRSLAPPPADPAPDGPEAAEWLRRELQAQIRVIKELREKERAESLTVEDGLKLGRMLVQLTDTFLKLNHHTSGVSRHAGDIADDLADDLPEDIDEFRIDLARRIDAFVASRRNAGDGAGAAAAPAGGA